MPPPPAVQVPNAPLLLTELEMMVKVPLLEIPPPPVPGLAGELTLFPEIEQLLSVRVACSLKIPAPSAFSSEPPLMVKPLIATV